MIPLSSKAFPELDAELGLFRNLFLAHGVFGQSRSENNFSERDRMSVVPLVFALVPWGAVYRNARLRQLKPLIRQHLSSIGLTAADEEFVEIVKEIADQIYFSSVVAVRSKMTLSRLRAESPSIYRSMVQAQAGRCSLCGELLTACIPTLDHRVPFKILGDPSDGANWQVICDACNTGKWTWFSALQPPVAHNWIYDSIPCKKMQAFLESQDGDIESVLGLTLRYCLFASKRACYFANCKRTVRESRMRIVRRKREGLLVWDHLDIACDHHAYNDV